MTSLALTVPIDPVGARLHPRLDQRADRLAQLVEDGGNPKHPEFRVTESGYQSPKL